MLEIILLIGVLGLVGATAYIVAARLFAGSLVDTLAASLLLFMTLLIGVADLLGIVGLLRLPLMLITLLLVCGLLVVLRFDLPTLIPASAAPRFRPSIVEVLAAIGLFILTLVVIIPPWFSQLFDANISLSNNDVIRLEIPNMMHFIQDGTLFRYSGQFSYYPFNYHMLLSWAPVLGKSFALFPYFHLLCVALVVFYAALLGMWALGALPPARRLLAGLVIIAVILAQAFSYSMFILAGKSDVFTIACMLMVIYYLCRYWAESAPRRTGYLVLVGIAGGLMIGAKWSSLFLAPIFAVIHLLLVTREGKNVHRWLLVVFRDALAVGLPVAFFGGIWLLRLVNYPLFLELNNGFDTVAWTTIVRRVDAPQVGGTIGHWLPLALAALGGVLLYVMPIKWRWFTGVRLISLAILTYSFLQWAVLDLSFYSTIGPMVFCLLVFLAACFGKWTVPRLVNNAAFALGVWGIISIVTFVFTPLSAYQAVIEYRYSPMFYLAAIVLVVLIAQFIEHLRPAEAVSPVEDAHIRFKQWAVGTAAVVLVVMGAVFRSVTYQAPETFTFWDNFNQTYTAPTSLFTWVRTNLHNASILTSEVPALSLYGDRIDNRVYVRPMQFFPVPKDAWFFTTDETVDYVNRNKITHVILPVGDFFGQRFADWYKRTNEMIEGLSQRYPIIFQDEQAVVFATDYSTPLPYYPDIHYEFDRLAAPGLYTTGFQRPGQGESFRAVVAQPAQVCANTATDRDVQVSFKVLSAAPPGFLDPLVVSVNDSPLELAREAQADGVYFEGVILKERLATSPSWGTCLNFDGVPISNTTDQGYALDWLSLTRITPIEFWYYDFTGDVPSDAAITGWDEPEVMTSGLTFRWSNESESVITINKTPNRPMRLEFRLTSALEPELIDELTLEANDVVIPLEHHPDVEAPNGAYFTAFLPGCPPESCPASLTLRFKTGKLSSPEELGMGSDPRRLGLQFDWLDITVLPSLS